MSMRLANPVLPVSHQFHNFSQDFRERFHTFEFRAAEHVADWAQDALVHTNLSLIDPDFERLIDFDALLRAPVRRFSFDIGPCYERVKVVGQQYVGIGPKLSWREVLDRAGITLSKVRSRFPPGCELAVEVLNYYPTGAYDGVCGAEFYNEACRRLNVGLVFDIAHARVTSANLGRPFADFLNLLDWTWVREVHLSRPTLAVEGGAIDSHDCPEEEEFSLLEKVLSRMTDPVDVVIEYYRCVDGIVDAYAKLFDMIGAVR